MFSVLPTTLARSQVGEASYIQLLSPAVRDAPIIIESPKGEWNLGESNP